jgi:hypothetical protein
MNWTELPGTELLRRVFSHPPKIDRVSLFDISLNRNGRTLTVNFDLIDQFPDKPPEKWKNFNRCRLGLYCAPVKDLKLTGWDLTNIVDLEIKNISDTEYQVCFSNENMNLAFICQFISIVGPSVYLEED